ncbi:hypothetical protein P167DRAFT_34153 [Morchella conica CCBAS932]|uniref:Uncharacterized protein n=1 Tax=Morchella conica CCBAS932 TaxID=1392247 RepID=A0A3N4L397_9PEZI|nr:hypothetical protein P167DRAFT_34153 [Morchella conica CCBAS932]
MRRYSGVSQKPFCRAPSASILSLCCSASEMSTERRWARAEFALKKACWWSRAWARRVTRRSVGVCGVVLSMIVVNVGIHQIRSQRGRYTARRRDWVFQAHRRPLYLRLQAYLHRVMWERGISRGHAAWDRVIPCDRGHTRRRNRYMLDAPPPAEKDKVLIPSRHVGRESVWSVVCPQVYPGNTAPVPDQSAQLPDTSQYSQHSPQTPASTAPSHYSSQCSISSPLWYIIFVHVPHPARVRVLSHLRPAISLAPP